MGMRIQNQPQINYNYGYKPNFTSSTREVKDELGHLLYRNVTHYFRDDIKDWNKYTNFIIDKFKTADKVNLYSIGCSTGNEIFGSIALIMEKLGSNGAKKFLPATAVDIDETILKAAQSGKSNASRGDIKRIKEMLGDNHTKYFNFDNIFRRIEGENEELCTATINPILLNNVKFIQSNAQDFVKQIEPKNSIVMARNFWPYLSAKDQIKLSEDLGAKLEKNSMCVLGEYDLDRCSADALLTHEDAGFDISDVDYVYVKRDTNENKQLSDPQFLQATFIPKK